MKIEPYTPLQDHAAEAREAPKFTELESIAPDKNVLEMTKIILEQNSKILDMNENLLKFLATSPILVAKNKE